MMHSTDSQIGIIDTGDLTLVKRIESRHDVVTWVEANPNYKDMLVSKANVGHKTYGDYGDVVIYKKNGLESTPVIHRAMVWVEYNASCPSPSTQGDIPDLGLYCVARYTLTDVGFRHQSITIDFGRIFSRDYARHSGFLTHGDNNPSAFDQGSLSDARHRPVGPVAVSHILGRAEGEVPWIGALKLLVSGTRSSDQIPPTSLNGMIVIVAVIIAVPVAMDVASYLRGKRKRESEEEEEEEVPEEEEEAEEDGPD